MTKKGSAETEETAIVLYQGFDFLGGRGTANRTRLRIAELLKKERDAKIKLDFANVSGVSHSFADELITPLVEEFGDQVWARLHFKNCSESVVQVLQFFARLHSVSLPTLPPRRRARLKR